MYISIGSGSDDPDNLGHSGTFLLDQVGLIHKKIVWINPDSSNEIRATGLYQQLAWLNVASEMSSISIYLFWTMWYNTRAFNHQSWSLSEQADRLALKNWYTLIEQSQNFQGKIRADSLKLGAVSYVSDLWSDSVIA